MKNIGVFTHDLYPFKPWGQGRYVYDLVRHLRPRSPRRILVFSPAPPERGLSHVPLFAGSENTLGKNLSYSLKLGAALRRVVRQYNLGLLHFQGGPGGLFLPWRTPVPVLYTVHHTFYQQARNIPNQKWKYVLFLWEKISYHLAAHCLCVSESTRTCLRKHYRVHPRRSTVVPNGVDPACFFPSDVEKVPESLFFLGRLESRKGIDFLIRAIPRVKAHLPDIRLFIGGEGNLRPFLETFVRRQGLSKNVHLLGVIPDGDVNRWYNTVSAVVIPSRFEGFGLTAIEAMAAGVPVVATDVDGLRDVVFDGDTGRLVPYGDAGALAEAVLSLLRDPGAGKRFIEKGRERVREVYNWNHIAGRVKDLYGKLVAE